MEPFLLGLSCLFSVLIYRMAVYVGPGEPSTQRFHNVFDISHSGFLYSPNMLSQARWKNSETQYSYMEWLYNLTNIPKYNFSQKEKLQPIKKEVNVKTKNGILELWTFTSCPVFFGKTCIGRNMEAIITDQLLKRLVALMSQTFSLIKVGYEALYKWCMTWFLARGHIVKISMQKDSFRVLVPGGTSITSLVFKGSFLAPLHYLIMFCSLLIPLKLRKIQLSRCFPSGF